MKDLKGHASLIVGASRGIGRAIAEEFINQGARVAFTYHSSDEAAKEIVKMASKNGTEAFPIQADARDIDSLRQMLTDANESLGGLDSLVFVTAGKIISKPTADMTLEEYDGMFDVVRGTYFALQKSLQYLNRNGSIVCFSTGGTKMAMPTQGAYTGAKAAIERFCLSLSKEAGEKGIRVNLIAPGVTKTDGLTIDKDMIEQLKQQTPLGRLGETEDIAPVVAFLISDKARWINGQIIGVNGGIL